jgi:serine/threonine-protein kinase
MFRDVFETAQQRSPDSPDPHMATWRQNLGRSLMLNGDLAAAKPLLDHPIEGAGDVADLAWERARRLAHLAEWSRRAHQPEQALRLADQAQAAFLALHPATRTRLGGVARTRALALRDLGRLDEAEREFDRAIADLTAGSGAQANATLEAALDRTDLLLARGRVDAARPGLRRLAAPVEARFVAESPPRRLLAELERRLGASP